MRNKLKKLCIFLVLFTTSFLINLYSQDLLGKELVKIRFATDWRAQAEQGGFYHALALGLYKERGLDVKIIQGNAGINIPRLLGSGEIEFGMGSNSFIPLNIIANNSNSYLDSFFLKVCCEYF